MGPAPPQLEVLSVRARLHVLQRSIHRPPSDYVHRVRSRSNSPARGAAQPAETPRRLKRNVIEPTLPPLAKPTQFWENPTFAQSTRAPHERRTTPDHRHPPRHRQGRGQGRVDHHSIHRHPGRWHGVRFVVGTGQAVSVCDWNGPGDQGLGATLYNVTPN